MTKPIEGTQPAVAETAKKSGAAHAGRFKKGDAKPKNSGRKPGVPNKIPADIKVAFAAAFAELQSDPKTELAAWARKSKANLRQFYVLCARALSRFEVNTQVNIDNREAAPVDLQDTARGILFVLNRAGLGQPEAMRLVEEHPGHSFAPAYAKPSYVGELLPAPPEPEESAEDKAIRLAREADEREEALQLQIIKAQCNAQSSPRPSSYTPGRSRHK